MKGSEIKKEEVIVNRGMAKRQGRAGFKLAKVILLLKKHCLTLSREYDLFFFFPTVLPYGVNF